MKVGIKKVRCLRCGHEWVPRKPDIRRCPGCKSFYFDSKKKGEEKQHGQIA